ncbi:MAG: hypothetical protein IPP14_11625 [Planctomycetes bacterium]|nr:hypothetical protein [Planctomycetota bacterium]
MQPDSTEPTLNTANTALFSDRMGGNPADDELDDDFPPMPAEPRPEPPTRGPTVRRAEAHAENGRGTGSTAPIPRYLQGLIDGGAFTADELQAVPHRAATVKFTADQGREIACPLAHLAPDAIATMRRRAGAGHVAGTVAWSDQDGKHEAHFALMIEPDAAQAQAAPDHAAPNPELAEMRRALERLEQRQAAPSPMDMLGRELVLDVIERARKPVDPMEQISKVIGEVRKLTSLGARMKAELAPLIEAAEDVREDKPGALARFMDNIASEENIQAIFEYAREKMTGVKTVDTTAEVSDVEGAE